MGKVIFKKDKDDVRCDNDVMIMSFLKKEMPYEVFKVEMS